MQDEARRALEAVIMVADQPADPALLAQLVEISPEAVEELLEELARTYEEQNRGFQLAKVAGGWRFQSHEDCAAYVERYVLTGQTARLSAAALETLAIVAYKQPISACAGRRHPWGGRRRRHADPPAARLHRRDREGPRSRPGEPVRHHRAVPGAARHELPGRTALPG